MAAGPKGNKKKVLMEPSVILNEPMLEKSDLDLSQVINRNGGSRKMMFGEKEMNSIETPRKRTEDNVLARAGSLTIAHRNLGYNRHTNDSFEQISLKQ